MNFEFSTVPKIIFGENLIKDIGKHAACYGKRALIVASYSRRKVSEIIFEISKFEIQWNVYYVYDEPVPDDIRRGVKEANLVKCEVIIAVGGGSVIDTAKAISVLYTNGGDVYDYLEVVGKGSRLTKPGVPVIAIPTTAGTGSEVTRNAVITSLPDQFKASIRSPYLLPALALVDPTLTLTLQPRETADTGFDALTQLIESYLSPRANLMTDMFCVEGISRIAKWLPVAYENGEDLEARRNMSFASLLSGMALANAGLGAVHGLAAVVGSTIEARHGAICAALLVPTLKMNLRAIQERMPESQFIPRLQKIAQILTGNQEATPQDAITWLENLRNKLRVCPLGYFKFRPEYCDNVAQKSMLSSSMKNNPVKLTQAELEEILLQAIDFVNPPPRPSQLKTDSPEMADDGP